MKVIVYEPTYNDKHCEILRDFAAGIPGATVKKAIKFKPGEADIGVVFGWYKYGFKPAMCKEPIIKHYLSLGPKRLLVVESAFQVRALYYQVGWGGFAGNADFMAAGVGGDRWNKLDIDVKSWRSRGGDCLVIGQLPRDTQVQDVDHIGWCKHTVAQCHNIYENVIFRPHPKCSDPEIYHIDPKIFDLLNLSKSLARAQCVVTWNSTTGVDAIIAGVPVIAMDSGAMVWPLASHTLEESLIRPLRQVWLNQLGYSQWTRREMREGLPWKHLVR